MHRDIKPGNILFNSEGDIKISDLGICGKMENSFGLKSTWIGTTVYMSVRSF